MGSAFNLNDLNEVKFYRYLGILMMHSVYGQLKPLGIDLNDNSTDLVPSWRVRRWSTESGPLCKFESINMAEIT